MMCLILFLLVPLSGFQRRKEERFLQHRRAMMSTLHCGSREDYLKP